MALELILGAPGSSTTNTQASIDKSYIAQRWSTIQDIVLGRVRLPPRAHRDAMALSLASVLRLLGTDPRACVRNADCSFNMGIPTSGLKFAERPTAVTSVRTMTATQLNSAGQHSRQHLAALSASYGRNKTSIPLVMRAAIDVSNGGTRALSDTAKLLLDRVGRPPELLALSSHIASRSQLESAAASLHPIVVEKLGDLLGAEDARAAMALRTGEVEHTSVAGNQALRSALLSGWGLLQRDDFVGRPPHVAYVYVVLVTMPASEWLMEYQRVIVKGERVSLLFGHSLPFGYRIVLMRMSALCKGADPSLLLTGFYIGQEHRGVKSKSWYERVKQHCTWSGSGNIRELSYLTNAPDRYVCTPHKNVVVERRIVSLLSAGENFSKIINACEALTFALCALIPGFVPINDSPPGESLRLLASTFAGPPRIINLGMELIQRLGGEQVRGCS